MLPFGESVGNHRTMIFNVPTGSLLGKFKKRVVHCGCERLNCQTSSLARYTRVQECLMNIHCMDEHLDHIITEINEDSSTRVQQSQMEALDRQMIEIQKCAEQCCHKVLKWDMEFRGPVKLWHKRMQA